MLDKIYEDILESMTSEIQNRIYSDLEQFKKENPEARYVAMTISHDLYHSKLVCGVISKIIATAKKDYDIDLKYCVLSCPEFGDDNLKFEIIEGCDYE